MTHRPEVLVLMGSGETTPTMIKTHRAVLDRVGDRRAVLLDTPYGFQSNADDISARATDYFAASVGRPIEVVSWRRDDLPPIQRERALADLRGAGWIFAGPGSPTYALRHWRDSPIPALLAQTRTLVFASAAALTLGSHAIPVYEIYKAGDEPCWITGLNLFEQFTGIAAVIIPHYDNAEGGNHDTRFCYLGEHRLRLMERQLPEGTSILGIDEHTAMIIDLRTGSVDVTGRGGVTVRRGGSSTRLPSGSATSLDGLRALISPGGTLDAVIAIPAPREPVEQPMTVTEAAVAAEVRFTAAAARGDGDDMVGAILDLEALIRDWSADTDQDQGIDQAREVLRALIVRLGNSSLQPLVESLLALRGRLRDDRAFGPADAIRQALTVAGVRLRDTTDGTQWSMQRP
ncbi:hypothetical protein F4553_001106 [Allocatelliglobosispora scoriae]|uniref:Cysteinyl-tRNA synthetase n=1 Tax=Allocatelliglobosispora scoriae TaxID=643052 RepID=A0A841BF64_9ACTN|nr:hypothetical protein [Allocatelliglobosispora scoriae]MBB5867727.1 hypothetical protein [Allocatelliglobosispora scoriae]